MSRVSQDVAHGLAELLIGVTRMRIVPDIGLGRKEAIREVRFMPDIDSRHPEVVRYHMYLMYHMIDMSICVIRVVYDVSRVSHVS